MICIRNYFCLALVLLLFNSQNIFSQTTYFQQQTDYTITVSLNDTLHELTAFETIDYYNNSPDVLNELYFHLWPNAYKNNSTALAKEFLHNGDVSFQHASAEQKGFIDGLDFKVDGEKINYVLDSANIDFCKLILSKPLLPGNKITITTPFHVKIPHGKFSRLGHIGQSYMISQWYPKPAVYDNSGWHPMPNVNQGEFYSEFGSFYVTITVPENYVVAATGNLQNEEEIKFLEKRAAETEKIKNYSKDNSFPPTSYKTKTITYKQSRIHDFAWFADKRFHVLSSEVVLPDSKRKVKTFAYFTNSRPVMWTKAPKYINDALFYYSKWNGDYPYETCSAVDATISAGGGMEYPTIAVIGNVNTDFLLEEVIVHEVGHNWFYGILGNNEREHAWMDEGINTFNELRYIYTTLPNQNTNFISDYFGIPNGISKLFGLNEFTFRKTNMIEYLAAARSANDQPLCLRAEKFSYLNYGLMVYAKSALIFDHMKSYLGDSLFDACMHAYFQKWQFKHPRPEDLKNVFEETSQKKLDWFFDDLINTTHKIDYSISSIKKIPNNGYSIKIKNAGTVNSPLAISAISTTGITNTTWVDGFANKKSFDFSCEDCAHFKINANEETIEINDRNNAIRTKGILKKFNPVTFQPIAKTENKNKTQIFYLPAVGYNSYDGFMAGAVFHNMFLIEKKFEYSIVPLYGFESQSFAGTGYAKYTLFNQHSLFDRIDFALNAKYFTDNEAKADYTDENSELLRSIFFSLPLTIAARIKPNNSTFDVNHFISVRSINVWHDDFFYNKELPYLKNVYRNYNQLSYSRINNNNLDPNILSITVEHGEKYIKSYAEIKQDITIGKSKKALTLRLFAGTFLQNDNTEINSSFKLSGWKGSGDYMYDEYYFGRNETDGLLRNQMLTRDGGLKTYYPLSTDKWMLSINIAYKLPVPFIKLFFDAATFERANKIIEGSDAVKFDAGICISVIKNAFEIYLPLFYSKEIKNFYELNDYKFGDKIRFVFDLKKLNPVKLREQIR